MSSSLTNSSSFGSSKFDLIKDSMLQANDLPLSEVVDTDQWQEIFDKHEINFGSDQDSVYTPAITLWALISQAFFKGEMRSCKAAVGRVAALWATGGKKVCSTNTGAYCRARVKITWQAIRDICNQLASSAESLFDEQNLDDDQPQHQVVQDVSDIQTKGNILMVDGFTVTAADTEANQAAYPQNPAQKEGLGFPIIRGVSLISMVTGLWLLGFGCLGTWPMQGNKAVKRGYCGRYLTNSNPAIRWWLTASTALTGWLQHAKTKAPTS